MSRRLFFALLKEIGMFRSRSLRMIDWGDLTREHME